MDAAEAGRRAFRVVHDVGEDQPSLDGIQGVRGGALCMVEEVPGDAPPGVGLGRSVVLGEEIELREGVSVPEEGAGGADAEDQGGRAQVDPVALAELGVNLADHGLDGRGVHDVAEAEVGGVHVVLEEGVCVLAAGEVDASYRGAPGARVLAAAHDAEGEGVAVIQRLELDGEGSAMSACIH